MADWKEYVEIIVGLASLSALVGAAVLAWLIAVRYRIPQLECRVKALEDINTGEIRTAVHKHELYNGDGRPIYMHRDDCEKDKEECTKKRTAELSQVRAEIIGVRAQLDAMEEARARARVQMIAFMAAVKEKLSLKFTIPDD